jgi:hypothetical protein
MRYTIVITKELQDTCNTLAKQNFDKQGGEKTFIAGLSPNGSLPITHYWASFIPSKEYGIAIEQMASQLDGVVIYKDKTAQEVLAEAGLQVLISEE